MTAEVMASGMVNWDPGEKLLKCHIQMNAKPCMNIVIYL